MADARLGKELAGSPFRRQCQAFEAKEEFLDPDSAGVVAESAIRWHDTMAGNHDGEGVCGHYPSHGSRGPGVSSGGRELAIGEELPSSTVHEAA